MAILADIVAPIAGQVDTNRHSICSTLQPPEEPANAVIRVASIDNGMPVVAGQDGDRLVGILDYRRANRKISAEVLRRREKADMPQGGL